MKRINNKGAVPVGLIIALVAVVAVAVVLFAGKGFGLGGGNGDDQGSDTADNSEISVIEELEYINVTVSGNEYIYDNKKVTLDELINSIQSLDKKLPVKISDEGSSLKAYKNLKAKLAENNIGFIEAE